MSLPTRKTCALLAYLAVNADRRQSRDHLATLLWGDRGERQARQSLSHALRSIRRLDTTSDTTLLENDGEHVTLRSDAMDIDVIRFHALLDARPADAAVLYDGPFLDGFAIPSPAFEEWLAITRAHLHDLACDALERAAGEAAAAGNGRESIDTARRVVRLDPIRESGHQLMIRLLCEHGDRASALRQYQVCADILKKELGVEPGPATQALRDAILKSPPIGQFNDAPQTADALPLRSIPLVACRHPAGGRVAAILASVLILFGVTLVPWQLPRTERTDFAPHLPTITALPDEPTQGAIAERRFANILERDAWYAGTKQAVEQIFNRRLASQHSDWDTLDCDTTTTPSARLICKDIAFEIQRLAQQKKSELDLLRQELALAVISPPKPAAPMMSLARDSNNDGKAPGSTAASKKATDPVAAPAMDLAMPLPAVAQPSSSDKTTPGEVGRDYVEKPDAGLKTSEIVTALERRRKSKPIVQDNGQSEVEHTPDTAKYVGVSDKRKGPPAKTRNAQAETIVALASATKQKTSLRKTIVVKESPDKPTTFIRKERQKAEVTSNETEARPKPKAATANKAPVLATRPALPSLRGGLVQSPEEIERYWRSRIEAVKSKGAYKDCEFLPYFAPTPSGSRWVSKCQERAEKIKEYSAALKSRQPFFDPKAIAELQAARLSRAEIEQHWRDRIEAVKQEGQYKDCDPYRRGIANGITNFPAPDGQACWERADKIKKYTEALKKLEPFFDPNQAKATLLAHTKSRAAFEHYVRQRVEKLKREGPHENCEITIINSHTDPSAFTDCEERAQEIQKLWAMLYTGKAPGKFAIARAPETLDRKVVDFETDRNLLQQAIVAYYLNHGYSNEPGPISTASAGVSEMQINSMQLREIDGKRLTVATEYNAETQDDFEVFSLASEFTLEKQDGAYRVVGHDPLGNRM